VTGDTDRDLASAGIGLLASPTAAAQAAEKSLRKRYQWAGEDEAQTMVAIGGDGFMLQTLHAMLEDGVSRPVFGMNRGTVGFLMNEWRLDLLPERIAAAKAVRVAPLDMEATTVGGKVHRHAAINEVSLLRETRQTAKLEVKINGKVRMTELAGDGVLVATPAGSTAYNLSANGPILPLGCNMLALTPISPFRPRRWKGAILPDSAEVEFRVREPAKRPVSAVADQKEVRDVKDVRIATAADKELTLLFDPGASLEERIFAEQFQA
jgi:NAD+ kinase